MYFFPHHNHQRRTECFEFPPSHPLEVSARPRVARVSSCGSHRTTVETNLRLRPFHVMASHPCQPLWYVVRVGSQAGLLLEAGGKKERPPRSVFSSAREMVILWVVQDIVRLFVSLPHPRYTEFASSVSSDCPSVREPLLSLGPTHVGPAEISQNLPEP